MTFAARALSSGSPDQDGDGQLSPEEFMTAPCLTEREI